ncbi:MAG: MFS transporter [Clostridiales Family XIII bacterium]|jgi:predicted MFS family arabinose efflux permease|nr:MFS transporter [Clostridiales Family XIII bacterium]
MELKGQKIYENKLILLFFLTWGFLFIDRLAISIVLPVIVPDLQITNTQVGIVNMGFTVGWAVSAIILGGIADKKGNLKMWLLISGFGTAIFGAACALSNSFETLLILRTLVGIAEGPFVTFLMAVLGKSISQGRLGLGVGIVNAGVSVIAITFGPIFLTQLIAVTTWQMTFLVAALPGLAFMVVVWRFVKPVEEDKKSETAEGVPEKPKNMFAELWSYRNFRVCCILAFTHMAGYYVMQIYASLYFTEVGNMDVQTWGFLMAAMGFVGMATSIIFPKISDNFGRKPVLLVSYILCVLPSLFMFLLPGSMISAVLYVAFAGLPGAIGIFWINLIPMETLPPYLTASGMAIPMALGELIGGALIGTIAGVVADSFGLANMMIIVSIGFLVSFFVCLPLIETAPRALERIAKKNA